MPEDLKTTVVFKEIVQQLEKGALRASLALASSKIWIAKTTDVESFIVFPNLNNDHSKWKMLVFNDASLGNLNNGTESIGAHILWIVDNEGNDAP